MLQRHHQNKIINGTQLKVTDQCEPSQIKESKMDNPESLSFTSTINWKQPPSHCHLPHQDGKARLSGSTYLSSSTSAHHPMFDFRNVPTFRWSAIGRVDKKEHHQLGVSVELSGQKRRVWLQTQQICRFRSQQVLVVGITKNILKYSAHANSCLHHLPRLPEPEKNVQAKSDTRKTIAGCKGFHHHVAWHFTLGLTSLDVPHLAPCGRSEKWFWILFGL